MDLITIFFLNIILIFRCRKNILNIIVAIELIMVNMLYFFLVKLLYFDSIPFLITLTIAAREAAVGLRLVTHILRQSGNDRIQV